jgi:hypothetical protein
MSPEAEARYALANHVARGDLSMAAQLEYDRIEPYWADGLPVPGSTQASPAGKPDRTAPAVHDGYAIASLVLSLVWLGGLGGILALIFGSMSCDEARKAGRQNSGMAIAGIWLSVLGFIGTVILIIVLVKAGSHPCTITTPDYPYCLPGMGG